MAQNNYGPSPKRGRCHIEPSEVEELQDQEMINLTADPTLDSDEGSDATIILSEPDEQKMTILKEKPICVVKPNNSRRTDQPETQVESGPVSGVRRRTYPRLRRSPIQRMSLFGSTIPGFRIPGSGRT